MPKPRTIGSDMGLILRCLDESAKAPKPVHLILRCDSHHGVFDGEPSEQTFTEDGYIAQHRAAVAAGWVFKPDGRIIGPCCSRKPVAKITPEERELRLPV
jgi:hypothetical protein